MDAFDLIKDKLAYNQWANQQVMEWLKEQPAAVYEKKVASSFPTINKLMHHLMEAEKYYFSILRQEEETYEKEMATDKIFEELLKIDQALLDWGLAQNSGTMDQVISLKRSPFVETYSIATLLTHVVNHSTYHRGQLLALRRPLGLTEAPRVDYYRYFIALSQM